MEILVVPAGCDGLELDEFLPLLRPTANKGFYRRAIRAGVVTLDGEGVKPGQRVREGDVVMLDLEGEGLGVQRAPQAPREEAEVLYEDALVVVLNKPPGVASEPERWEPEAPSMVGAFEELAAGDAAGEDGLPWRPRLLHRLDKDTSGALAAAKELEAERLLRGAFAAGDVHKEYLALVEGEWPDDEEVRLDGPIGEDHTRRGRRDHRMAVAADGKPSVTRVRPERRFRGYTLLRCLPETGRTHQIRVHLAHAGFPLAVDPLYGRRDALLLSDVKAGYRSKPGRPERPLIERLTLHATRLDLPNPCPGSIHGDTQGFAPDQRIVVDAPLPKDLDRTLRQLAKVRPPRR